MPELPEVETIRKSLEPHVVNRKIMDVFVGEKKLRWEVDRRAIQQYALNQTIHSVLRRGKYLIWSLYNRAHVIFHFGMSGRLLFSNKVSQIEKHTHVVFYLSNQGQIHFCDPRRFGFVKVLAPMNNIDDCELFSRLGPEPLSPDFSTVYLYQALTTTKRPIKHAIMDAKIVVGIGNIYANEALFLAKIRPDRAAKTLTINEVDRLVTHIKAVLKEAIALGGTTLADYVNADKIPGFFQLLLKVYGRSNRFCVNCKSRIKKISVGQRSSFYCEKCQH